MGSGYMYAFGGMEAWKAVSNTATCGVSGRSSCIMSMQASAGGLCSGASSSHFVRLARAAASMMTDFVKYSPPATMRLPMASIWLRLLTGDSMSSTITSSSFFRQSGTVLPATL